MTSHETAIKRHDRMWREERDQAERLRSDHVASDHWQPNASTFQPVIDEREPVADALAQWAGPDGRVIDVGAGGGRIAVPLARRVRELVAVEPSESMRDVLTRAADEHGADNIEIVASTWEDADVAPADLVFAAHVTYSVPRIEPFLRKMDRAATGRVALVTFGDPAQHVFAPFWKQVHGEERLRLPVRNELIAVLREMGVDPRIDPRPPRMPASFGTPEEAFDLARRRLFIGEGTPAATRLRNAMRALTEERDGEVWVNHATPNEISMLSWKPGRM
ncbi:MAG: class I SAM-dependent methyltransferase [Chloroflexia bacterium]|nr:class I SAM-dependent methyltransferase [Chloroflexia bacterium]